MIIAREVAAAKAHIASFVTKRERFAAAAERTKANPTMETAVTSKSILWPIACCGLQLCRQCGLAAVHKTSFARVDPRTICVTTGKTSLVWNYSPNNNHTADEMSFA
jgi:hypothetical protein